MHIHALAVPPRVHIVETDNDIADGPILDSVAVDL